METILIQNFKAIKNTAKREIKVANLTILMGEQATGKSTVAKLVYFFKKLPEEILFYLLRDSEIHDRNFEDEIRKTIALFFYKLFDFSNLNNDFLVIYKYNNDLKIEINKNKEKNDLFIKWSNTDLINEIKEKWHQFYHAITPPNDDYVPLLHYEVEHLTIQLVKKIGLVFGFNQNIIYVPASRNIVVSMESQLFEIFSSLDRSNMINGYSQTTENEYIISNYIKHIQKIKNKFKGRGFSELLYNQISNEYREEISNEILLKIQKILNGRYRSTQSGEKIYFDESDNFVLIENSSSGQQEIIRVIQDIFIEVLENRPVFRVYEELESHLSPVGQLAIIQLIAILANRNPENQIIIPTHTLYLLQEVSNMLKASKIVKDNPELRDEVGKVLKPFYWLDLDSVSAYQLNRDGEIEDAKDIEYQMIDGTLFDKVTNDIGDQLDRLLSLQYE